MSMSIELPTEVEQRLESLDQRQRTGGGSE